MDVKDPYSFRWGIITLAAVVVVLAGLKAAAAILAPLLLALFIATIASTPINWLTSRRVPVALAILIVLIVIVLALLGVGTVVMQSARELFDNQIFYQERLTEITIGIFSTLNEWGLVGFASVEELVELIDPAHLWSLSGQTLIGLGNALTNGFLILLVFIFVISEGAALPSKIRALIGSSGGDYSWLDDFATNINRYIAIKTAVSLLTGVIVTVLLFIIGVDFPVLWGLLAFLLNYIPNIGSIIAAAPAVLLAMIQLGGWHALATASVYLFANVVMGAYFEPKFMGKSLGLSVLVVFLSLVFWGWMFGAIGMLLSVPITMTIKIAAETRPSTAWIGILLGPGGQTSEDQTGSE